MAADDTGSRTGCVQQNSIEQAFRKYVGDSKSKSPVLLVKAGASMDIQEFLELCQMARNAGFDEVQIAADPGDSAKESRVGALALPKKNNSIVFPVQ